MRTFYHRFARNTIRKSNSQIDKSVSRNPTYWGIDALKIPDILSHPRVVQRDCGEVPETSPSPGPPIGLQLTDNDDVDHPQPIHYPSPPFLRRRREGSGWGTGVTSSGAVLKSSWTSASCALSRCFRSSVMILCSCASPCLSRRYRRTGMSTTARIVTSAVI